jgi:type II secretory pathway predicted ATPase ExeA
MNHKLSGLYGLKFNPFTPEIPMDALYVSPRTENFLWRIENALVREGGFALIHGDPGTGKSVVMRLLEQRLSRLQDRLVASINHPQSNVADFYRELGDLFNIPVRPAQRWNSFKALRERWIDHLANSRRRSILLVDEAQEMSSAVMSELRLMASHRFDSQMLLCVVLAGDARLQEKLRREDLLPLGSRIRVRLALEAAKPEELRACLDHLLETAGNATLMTAELRQTLCDHALGNYRVLTAVASELLLSAAKQDLPQLDEKLYLQHFSAPQAPASRRSAASR